MERYEPPARTSWLTHDGPETDVVVTSRVRLARNIAGVPFVNRCVPTDLRGVLELAEPTLRRESLAPDMAWVPLHKMAQLDRQVLVERHLISGQHSKGELPRAVAISSPDESLAVMVNEEDHLRIQIIRPGLALREAFKRIDAVDDDIESNLDYAYHPQFGYLTACPTNVGTGIRLSVMLHLPGLKLANEIEKVRRAAQAMSLAVRGIYGEGSEASGDMYQISNQTTLGKSEQDLLEQFETQIIPQVIEYERVARRSLLERRRVFLEDHVFRALGVLRNARLLKADEALSLISHVRLGVALGLIDDVPVRTLNELILVTQPGHLQRTIGREMDQAERRVQRAALVRERLTATPPQRS
jgi:protein arginine kinase